MHRLIGSWSHSFWEICKNPILQYVSKNTTFVGCTPCTPVLTNLSTSFVKYSLRVLEPVLRCTTNQHQMSIKAKYFPEFREKSILHAEKKCTTWESNSKPTPMLLLKTPNFGKHRSPQILKLFSKFFLCLKADDWNVHSTWKHREKMQDKS